MLEKKDLVKGMSLRVIACNHGHDFNIGDIVTFDKITDKCKDYTEVICYKGENTIGNCWYLRLDELTLI
jgi:hypothetical protein